MMVSSIDSNNLTGELVKKIFFSIEKEDYEYADYLILYGCHLKELLDERLEQALKIIKLGKVKKIVLTGGIGVNGNFNESEYMLDYLIKNNVDQDMILVENQSTTTEENNINVMNLLNFNEVNSQLNVVLVTHQFHLLKLIMHWNKILDNNYIHFYFDYVQKTKLSYDNIIKDPKLMELLKSQLIKIKKYIDAGIYDDFDIKTIK